MNSGQALSAVEGRRELRHSLLGERKDSLLVPSEAVIEEEGHQYICTVEEGRAKRLTVKRGWVQDRWREIVAGVEQ